MADVFRRLILCLITITFFGILIASLKSTIEEFPEKFTVMVTSAGFAFYFLMRLYETIDEDKKSLNLPKFKKDFIVILYYIASEMYIWIPLILPVFFLIDDASLVPKVALVFPTSVIMLVILNVFLEFREKKELEHG